MFGGIQASFPAGAGQKLFHRHIVFQTHRRRLHGKQIDIHIWYMYTYNWVYKLEKKEYFEMFDLFL